ncbi:MAG: DUF5058 family protein [Firmicutes bacterium]|mgnify:FL=1|nr:DUF5058 family protein [Bacillota bacterium]
MATMSTANFVLWIFAIILIGFTFVQAGLFVRRALQFNKRNHVFSTEELKGMVKTGAMAALAPGINTVFLGLSLMSITTSSYMFMRCGVIGAPFFELMIITYAQQIAGIDLAATAMTPSILTYLVFASAFGCVCFVLGPVFTLKPIEMAGKQTESTKPSLITRALPKAALGMMSMMSFNYFVQGKGQAFSWTGGFIAAFIVYTLIGKGKKGLTSWALLISTITGILVGQLAVTFLA